MRRAGIDMTVRCRTVRCRARSGALRRVPQAVEGALAVEPHDPAGPILRRLLEQAVKAFALRP
jgi:hypothetical protein